ncbi:MAG: sigma-70 family RNA polymerase sigma factor [Ilumatobacter sp.]|nr:sigma-70 family RNA polymerase sigma factor [Ilumatobacter sp.]
MRAVREDSEVLAPGVLHERPEESDQLGEIRVWRARRRLESPVRVERVARVVENRETAAAVRLDRAIDERPEATALAGGSVGPVHCLGPDLQPVRAQPWGAEEQLDEQLEGRELYAYLQDAISLLPERHRLVIVGYFLEEKTSVDLARFLGVTESRVSQLRSDAIEMLRLGITSQYEDAPAAPETGRRAERRKQYANAIGEASDWRHRLDEGADLSTRIRSVL